MQIMGSSIRSYLRLRWASFRQIPTLAGVLTSSAEGDKGSKGLMLCLHYSSLFLFGLPLCIFALSHHRWPSVFVYCLGVCVCRACRFCAFLKEKLHMQKCAILHFMLSALYVFTCSPRTCTWTPECTCDH